MRIMVKFSFPVDTGNTAIRTGKVEKFFHQIMEDLKPEAAYFFPDGGERGGFVVVNDEDAGHFGQVLARNPGRSRQEPCDWRGL